jgi:Glycosyltransferase Family 4
MVRIARIITRLNIGGPAIQAAMLSDRLRERGFETLLIYGRLAAGEGDMSYLLNDRQVQSSYMPSLVRSVSPLADARAAAAILRQLKAFKPQIVHTHTAKAGTVGRAASLAYNRSAATKARTVHTYHGHSLEGYFRFAGAFISIERLLARSTDRLIAISPRIAADLRDRYHIGRPGQWTVVPLGFDLAPLVAIDDGARAAARRSDDARRQHCWSSHRDQTARIVPARCP